MSERTQTTVVPGAIGARHLVNRLAVAVAVASLPAWSISFAESSTGFILTMTTTIAVLAALLTIDRGALDVVRSWSAPVLFSLALAATAVVAFVFHPSGAGAILTFAVVTPVGIVLSVAGFDRAELRRFVAGPLLATTAIQAAIVVVQSITETAFGYNLLHPGAELLVTNETIARPQGLFDHVYEPAAVALIAVAAGLALVPAAGRARWLFLGGIAAATTTVALTHSRSALLGLMLVVAVAVLASIRRDRDLRIPALVTVVAFLIPALLTASAWQVRFNESTASDLDDASLGRLTLARQAIDMAGDHPIVGVGPNRYMTVLETDYTVDQDYPYVVHNESLMMAAELGIPAGILLTALMSWAGIQALLAGYRPTLLYVAPLGFYVFDVLLYNKPVGLLLFAVWCGVLAAMTGRSESPSTTVVEETLPDARVPSHSFRNLDAESVEQHLEDPQGELDQGEP
jgi:O-Antigen ligase